MAAQTNKWNCAFLRLQLSDVQGKSSGEKCSDSKGGGRGYTSLSFTSLPRQLPLLHGQTPEETQDKSAVRPDWHRRLPPGTEVPRATNTTAVTESLRPMVQPKWEARSPVTAVRTPMREMDTKKQAQPFQYSVGGTKAKRTFQKTVRKCIM